MVQVPISDAELSELYMRYAPVLYVRARSILGDDAEANDAVQETFARVIRAGDRFRGEASPLTWMYQINTNWCLNRLRNNRGHRVKHEEKRSEILEREFDENAVDERLDHATLRGLLTEESDENRRMVIHLFFDDMTREEAAKVMGISVPTLRKRLDLFLRGARRKLGIAAVLVLFAAGFTLLRGGS